tara:strand:+ start:777 stop:1145 length:369 start_codon:yes stop_codon:yes gene_type:complete
MFIEGIAGYVDATTVEGVLSGVFVAAGAVALRYVFNRLWQRSLIADAALAIAAAHDAGLCVHPLGFGPRVEASGDIGGVSVRVRWEGGIRGERTIIWMDGSRQTAPLVRSAEGLHAALGSEE